MSVPRFTVRKLLWITTVCALVAAGLGFFSQVVGWRGSGQTIMSAAFIVVAMILTGWYRLRQER